MCVVTDDREESDLRILCGIRVTVRSSSVSIDRLYSACLLIDFFFLAKKGSNYACESIRKSLLSWGGGRASYTRMLLCDVWWSFKLEALWWNAAPPLSIESLSPFLVRPSVCLSVQLIWNVAAHLWINRCLEHCLFLDLQHIIILCVLSCVVLATEWYLFIYLDPPYTTIVLWDMAIYSYGMSSLCESN